MSSTEALLHYLKEVKNAKACLEKKRDAVEQKRKEIEAVLEADIHALDQVKDRYTKMLETSHVAQHKAAQTQSQFNSLEDVNQSKKKNIEAIEEEMKQEESRQFQDTRKFEKELTTLSKILTEAKDAYSDSVLESRIAETEQEIQKQKQNGAESESHLKKVSDCVAKLEVDQSEEDMELDRQTVWDLFTKDEEKASSALSQYTSDVTGTLGEDDLTSPTDQLNSTKENINNPEI